MPLGRIPGHPRIKYMQIVVTGLITTYPLGGVSWDYIQYLKGFHDLGHKVYYLEDTGQWVYNPRLRTFTDDCSFNLSYLADVLASVAPVMSRCWSYRSPKGEYFGLEEREIEKICDQADIFLNLSGSCWLRERYQNCRKKIYVDSDPLYTQYKLEAMTRGTATPDQAYSVDLILKHDLFFTLAENIGDCSCRIPHCGLTWHTTRQPIVLEDWLFNFTPTAEAFTTVMSWKNDVTLPSIGGETYGGKDVEFMKFVNLPSRVSVAVEIALSGAAPFDQLRQNGWQLVDGYEKSLTMDVYRRYLGNSRGEWSIAKNAYVASCSGWFSTRSAAYLALGKPVVVQDTGFRPYYPTSEGLFAFSTVDEAVSAIETIESNYRRHCEAARAIAEKFFAAQLVLDRLLIAAGC
jgi:hypothetical protein